MRTTTASLLPFLSVRNWIGSVTSLPLAKSNASKGSLQERSFCFAYNSALKTANGLLFIRGGHFQHREEGFLRNIHLADALHAALAFFLLFEEFAFARDIAAVAFGQHVFADGRDGFAR